MRIIITGASGFIGTNLLEFYLEHGWHTINIDCCSPQNKDHLKFWKCVDITDYHSYKNEVLSFDPEYFIHLAAKTDLEGKTLEDYRTNTLGIQNTLSILKQCKNLKRAIFASSQLVCKGRMPTNDNDYNVVNLYGESKKQGELLIKNDPCLAFEWAIIRPTSIWGPWFREPYNKFFKVIISGKYFHIGRASCTKTYGFVGNIVYQIDEILKASFNAIDREVFYLGDIEPYNIEEWSNEIASFTNSKINRLPLFCVKILAIAGDLLKKLNINFPMTTYRLKNMTNNNIRDLSKVFKIAPKPPFTRTEGIQITLEWLKRQQ